MEEIKIRDKTGTITEACFYGRRWSRGKVCDHGWPSKG